MFSILRSILIIGAIFYFSPVRHQSDSLDRIQSPRRSEPAAVHGISQPVASPDRLETIWQALPESTKQTVIDKILTASGLGPTEVRPTDTLRSGDRQPEWRGEAAKPRT